MSMHKLSVISTLAASTLLAGVAHAQSGASAQAAALSAQADGNGGEILVTARKRSESLLDVPISITAFSGADLEKSRMTSVQDIQNSVPSLQYSPRGDFNNQIYIRGVGGDARNIGIESGVSLYVDGVFAGRTAGYNQFLTNIAQVEVLRGPQGTLFGKNTTGGVINITTKRPSETTEGEVKASYGNYDAVELSGSFSGPITDNLFAGVMVAGAHRDGYIYNVVDQRKLQNVARRGGRVQLLWKAPFGADFYWTADRTTNNADLVLGQTAPPFTGIAAPYGDLTNRFQVAFDQENFSQMRTTGGSQTIDYTLDSGIVLTSITAYRSVYGNVFGDSDAQPIDTLHSGPFTDESDIFSQEVRVASPDRGPVRYVAGVYYADQSAYGDRKTYVSGSLPTGYSMTMGVDTQSIGLFANVDLHLVDRLTITGGVRYTSEKKDGYFHQISTGRNYQFDDLNRKDTDFSWTGSVNYRVTPDLSFYATASRGFKSGGFNLDAIALTNVQPESLYFDPEKLTNFEAGVKGKLFDGMVTFSADAFTDNFDNKQVARFVDVGGLPVNQISNAGKARIRGFEAEFSIRPDTLTTVNVNASHIDAKYTSFENAAVVNGAYVAYTGNVVEGAPAWGVNGSIDRRQPVSFGYLTAHAEVRYTGLTYFNPDNLVTNSQKPYTLANARVGFETEDGNLSVSLWGKNLFNKSYFTFARMAFGERLVYYGEPRFYGIEVIRKF